MIPNHYRKYNDPVNLILFFLVLAGLVSNWNYSQRTPGADYYVAWTVASAARNGSDYRIYDRDDQRRLSEEFRSNALVEGPKSRRAAFADIPFFWVTGTPFFYATVKALSTNDYQTSLKIWNALSLFGFCTSVLLISRLLGLSRTFGLTMLLACLFWMNAFHSDLRVANVNSIQLGLLAMLFFLLSRGAKMVFLLAAGFLVALIAFLKPNLAPISMLLLGVWLIRGRQKEFLAGVSGMVMGAIFSLGISSYVFGSVGIWLEWLDGLNHLAAQYVPESEGNFNMLRTLDVEWGAGGQLVLAAGLCALTLMFLYWGRRANEVPPEQGRKREIIENAQIIGLGCLVHMITTSLVWLHYYLLAIPMIIVAFRPWIRTPAHGAAALIRDRLVPTLIFLVFLDGPHWQLYYDHNAAIHAVPNMVAIVALYLLGLWQLRFRGGSSTLVATAD